MICPRLARFVFDLPCKSAAGSQSRRFWASLRSTEEQLVAAGTISVSEVQHFDGTLITVPFGTGEPRSTVTEQYQAFLKEYIQKHPRHHWISDEHGDVSGGTQNIAPGSAVPRVTSLVVQATDVVNQTDNRERFSQTRCGASSSIGSSKSKSGTVSISSVQPNNPPS